MGSGDDAERRRRARERRGSAPRRRESVTISFEAREYLSGFELDDSLLPGARNALAHGLELRPGSTLLLVVHGEREVEGAALLAAADELGVQVTAFVVNARQADNGAFVNRLLERLSEMDASCLVAAESGLPPAFLRCLRDAGAATGRHAHMVGTSADVFQTSLRADLAEVDARSEHIREHVTGHERIEVTTTVGTHLTIGLDPERRWHAASGRLTAPGWTELPGGVVFTTPATVDGLLVPDGGVWLPDGTRLKHSVRLQMHFERGVLARLDGPDAEGARALLTQLDADLRGRRVGRVCLGTNSGLLTAVGSRLQDTKMPGFHLVLGDPLPGVTEAAWSSEVAAIALPRRVDVSLDGRPLLIRGRYARRL